MRVLLLNDYAVEHGGGAEVHVGRLAEGLRRSGDDVVVHAPEPHRGSSRLLDVWDPWHRRAVRALVDDFRPDVVHVHNFQRELSASVLAAAPHVPLVVTVHDYRLLRPYDVPPGAFALERWARDVKTHLERALVRRAADAVVAVSDPLAAELRAAGLPGVRCIEGFAADPDGEPSPPGRDVVYLGQLIPAKGVTDLIEAFATVVGDRSGVALRIAGAGHQEAELRRHAGRIAGDRVRFEGHLDEDGVRRLLEDAAVVAVPSKGAEGSSMVAIEAMLAGRPVVVTDLPALRRLVDDGVHGSVVPVGDPRALAAALSAILDDPSTGRAMGSAGFERATARFTASAAVQRFRSLYGEVSGGRS